MGNTMNTTPAATAPLKKLLGLLLCAISTNADVVEFGACFQKSTNSHRCAINSSYCKEGLGEVWFKPYELKSSDGRKLCTCGDTHIGACSPNHGFRGNCALEKPTCPANNDFYGNVYFYNDGASCMCHGMTAHPYSTNTIETEKTLYGACEKGDEYRCAVYTTSCEQDERWLSPIELTELGKPQCTCDKVMVGSCFNPISDQCAVDSESCDDAKQFVSPFATKEQGKECFLCGIDVFDENLVLSDAEKNAEKNADDNSLDDDKYPDNEAHLKSDGVSINAYRLVLGFMIAGVVCSAILTTLIVIKKKEEPTRDDASKSVNGSVV